VHIVLLTHYFPPEVNAPAQRAYDHAKAWTAAGCKVTVVTTAPSHPYGRLYDGYRNVTLEQEVDGFRVVRLRTLIAANAGTLKRSLSYLSYLISAVWERGRVADADIVVSTSPQLFCGLAGYPVSRRARAPWVLEIRDIWPESIIAVGAARGGLLLNGLSQLAGWAYRTCDLLVSVSPGFAPHFAEHGVDASKILLAPNGVDVGMACETAAPDEFPQLRRLQGRFIAAYVGTFGLAHGLSTLLETANLLRDDPTIGFVLVGAGAEREKLAKAAAAMALSNLVLLDQQPRERIARLWGRVDASIVHLKDQPVFNTVIPTKLLEGMAMGKPVLLGVRGQARAIVEAADCGVSFTPEDPQACADAVRALASDRELAAQQGARGRRYVCEHFDRQAIALRYLKALQRTVAAHRQPA
jgi:colanic acid biosynthesis glycosyl transferase WcaI